MVVEVHVGEGDAGEVLPAGTEPAPTRRVGALSTTGTTHVVDHHVHVDVNLPSDRGREGERDRVVLVIDFTPSSLLRLNAVNC